MHHLFSALAEAGTVVRVVALDRPGAREEAPYTVRLAGRRPRGWAAVAHHVFGGLPPSLARFRSTRLLRAVDDEVRSFGPDLVHLEQLQLAWLIPHLPRRLPVVLREQNVESRILERLVSVSRGPARWLTRREALRVAAAEAAACRLAGLVAAISEEDAAALRALAPDARVEVVPPAWPAPAGPHGSRLDGDPPLICAGSFDWLPNRDGARWLLDQVWPLLGAELPHAVLHLAGPGRSLAGTGAAAVIRHGTVDRALFDPRAIAVVPVRAGSGVRVRLLEAWSLGLPAITTAVGGEGLVGRDGDGALLADEPASFAAALTRLAGDGSLRGALIARGRDRLVAHEPSRVAARLLDLYRSVLPPV
jgi:glycosyltransferase involved in cell wall biosynthesis